ncbi:hypothetical protein U3A58_08015 [Algoriphagus sp. C2-6-M1]|uniref:hypothetical protein n=1 Tax=Algoriphagus persicinus TaxID=3108754 RepID=UPI002B3AD46C|nr:hypothetical protein [Algoriphagus sp. C2-6-M1]MEB2780336.1 hypothetical protein [Algoriphagus sp. C2-6-M1]
MKKALSIFLLVCFAIYHFGYYAFYFSYDQHLESKWEDLIYSESSPEVEERLLEIPLSMPYMANQEEFQSTNTPYEQGGKYYRVIKQRYQNDTLQFIVLPDTERRVLTNSVKKWISSLMQDELPQDQNNKTTVKLFVKDYLQADQYSIDFSQYSSEKKTPGFIVFRHSNPFCQLDNPPPKII